VQRFFVSVKLFKANKKTVPVFLRGSVTIFGRMATGSTRLTFHALAVGMIRVCEIDEFSFC